MATVNSVKTTDSSLQKNAGEVVSKSLDDIVKRKLKDRASKKDVLPVLQHVDLPTQRELREASLPLQGGKLTEIRVNQTHNLALSRILRLPESADTIQKNNDIAVTETGKNKTSTAPGHDRFMINPGQKKLPDSAADRSDTLKIANGTSPNPAQLHLASSLKKVDADENRVMQEAHDSKKFPVREIPLHQLSANTSAPSQQVNNPEQATVFKPMNMAKNEASWGRLVETSRVADNSSEVKEGAGNSKLTYTFSDWGKGHQVNVQISSNQGTPNILHPSDPLVHQRLSDHSGQHHGQNHRQPEWVFHDEHEQSQRAHKQPQPDEEQT